MFERLKKYGKHTIIGWSWRTLLWGVLTPFILFALLALLIYFPPVQKWAVDKAAERLSEEMGMEVTVENVRLKFPLDLSMGGVLAVQEGDTVLFAEELQLSVQPRPLLDKEINVDDIILRNANVNTRGLIDEVLIKGHIGELQAYTHGVSLPEKLATVNKLNLSDADILIAIPDTVPPDTTESEPNKWKLDLQDIAMQKVKFALSMPQGKQYDVNQLCRQQVLPKYLDTYFEDAKCRAFVDLENSVYMVNGLEATNSTARVEESVDLKNTNIKCDSIRYADPMDLYVRINKMSGEEKCGIKFQDVSGVVRMDSTDLYLDELAILTDDSKIDVNMQMNLNTWDEKEPGVMRVDVNSVMGKSDMMSITRYVDRFLADDEKLDAVRDLVQEYMPVKPTPIKATVMGNINDLSFDNIQTTLDGVGTIEGSARMRGDVVETDIHGKLLGGDVLASGSYNINDEVYDVDLNLRDFNVNKYVDLPEKTTITGLVHAKGKGFEPYAPSTSVDATADIKKGRYGKVDLSTIKANLGLKNSKMILDLACDNSQIKTDFNLSGVLRKNKAEGTLDINLPFADLKAMGFSDETLTVGTSGKLNFSSNLDSNFKINSYMNGLDLTMGKDKLHTDDFDLFAETSKDSTVACLTTGDLDFDFNAPYNLSALSKRIDRLNAAAQRQMKKHSVNLDLLKAYMPEACLRVKAGANNPVSAILKRSNIKFEDFVADLDASPKSGITGYGHLSGLMYDSIRIDSTYFDIYQDSDRIAFTSGVKCANQPLFPAFNAKIDGYYTLTEADARLRFYNDKGDLGIDVGAHVVDRDSTFHIGLYPETPIIGFNRYAISKDNYIDIYKDEKHPIMGYVDLDCIDDNSRITITGLEEEGEQRALVEITDFNLGEFCKVIPFMPNIDGIFNLDAAYQEKEGKFWVDGMTDIYDLVYEDMRVGNVGSMFTYEPEDEGMTVHKLEGDISYEGYDIATIEGRYDAKGDGYLDADLALKDIPMKIFSPFIPEQFFTLDGKLGGIMTVKGPTDKLQFDGFAVTDSVYVQSPYYSVNLRLADDTLRVVNSRLLFDKFAIYGSGQNPLMLNGHVDFADMDNLLLAMQISGRNVELIDSKQTVKSLLYGNAFGDIYANVTGTSNDINIRGYVNVLPKTNLTYVMSDAVISQGDRLDDIVTFVDFSLPPDTTISIKKPNNIMGIDMQMNLNVEDGTKFRVDISADKQSYVDVRGGGSLNMVYTPEGVMNVLGKLTVSEGEMKYSLPIIPLKTFKIDNGSYVEFTGDVWNPTLSISAKERTKAQVSSNGGSSQSVAFDVGMEISKTLNDMGLAFTIGALNNPAVQEELDNYTDDEKNKLSIALLATGMYLADSNSAAITADNALSSFLQSQINSIAGRALGSFVDVSLGMDDHTYDDGSRSKDYSFKFSKRFFSDRLNVVIGGSVSDNEDVNRNTSIGSFIDDVSLEWRLDQSATRYVTLFHRKDYENPVEGVLEKNGAGIVLRKKLSSVSDIMFWKKKKNSSEDNEHLISVPRAEERRKEEKNEDNK